MRRIDRSCLSATESPIRHLMEHHLANAVFRIAPEREFQFETSLQDYDLIYLDERQWKAAVDIVKREIFLSRGTVEVIWCASLAHFLFYTKLIQGKKFDEPGELDPHSDPEVSSSLRLLGWALESQLNNEAGDDWPDELPRPLSSPGADSNEKVADELTLVTCAYILHHELAHIRLVHDGKASDDVSRLQEKEADIEAAEWILDRIDVQSPMFLKRMLGIVQAFLLSTALGLYGGTFGGRRHPFSYDRLTSLIARFIGQDSHLVHFFAFVVLDLHFQNSGRKIDRQKYNDPEEALQDICDYLAEEQHLRELQEQRNKDRR